MEQRPNEVEAVCDSCVLYTHTSELVKGQEEKEGVEWGLGGGGGGLDKWPTSSLWSAAKILVWCRFCTTTSVIDGRYFCCIFFSILMQAARIASSSLPNTCRVKRTAGHTSMTLKNRKQLKKSNRFWGAVLQVTCSLSQSRLASVRLIDELSFLNFFMFLQFARGFYPRCNFE